MKVAIVSPYQTVNPHFEAELELMQRHLDDGDQVLSWSCLGQQTLCDFNIQGDRDLCRQCSGRRQMGLELLSAPIANQPIFKRLDDVSLPAHTPAVFASLHHLKSFRLENFDIGYACLSSLVSSLRDPEPDLQEHRQRVRALLQNSWAVYRSTLHRLEKQRPDRVYVFNGRFAVMRAVLRAAEAAGVPCFIHERGATFQRYQLFENHLPHDLDAMRSRMQTFWDQYDPATRTESAEQWFSDRRERIERGWKSFVKQQQRNALPPDWSPDRHNVVLFCSSEDEFAAIGDSWDQRPYPTQVDGVRHMLSLLQPNTVLTVRLHPNLKDAPPKLIQPFLAIDHPQLRLILPDSPIDSYALLDHASTCISFGSSVGIEAVFYRKPSVLLGPCFYRDLPGTYQALPRDLQNVHLLESDSPPVLELRKCLNQSLEPQSIDGALIYALWMQENGIEYKYFQATAFNEGTFKGQVVHAAAAPKSWKGKLKQFWKTCQRAYRNYTPS